MASTVVEKKAEIAHRPTAFFPLLEKAQQQRKEDRAAAEASGTAPPDDPFSSEALDERAFESDDLHEQRKAARMDSMKEMVSLPYQCLPPSRGC